jgi:hypothetical protein
MLVRSHLSATPRWSNENKEVYGQPLIFGVVQSLRLVGTIRIKQERQVLPLVSSNDMTVRQNVLSWFG